MGILFQHSCFLAPDDKYLQAQHEGRVKKTTTKKLMRRRRRQIEGIVQEARAWMYALLIPSDVIANGDGHIKQELDEKITFLTTTLLGNKIDPNKINAVCGKIARNILVHGTTNLDPGQTYPPIPSYEQVKHLLDARFIRAGYLELIYDKCEDFLQNHPYERTWHEVRQVARYYTFEGEPLHEVLDRWQHDMTWAELGVPFYVNWRLEAEREVYDRIRTSDSTRLTDFTPAQRDLILARHEGTQYLPDCCAVLDPERNAMTLNPLFYNSNDPDSLQKISMQPDIDLLHNIRTRVSILLHELTHSPDVLNSEDHKFKYREDELDYLPTPILLKIPWELDMYHAYGLEACIALARRDKHYNLNKAEDNADSWAYYFTLRILLLVYPDIDIAGALHTTTRFQPQSRHLLKRVSLLHHCSLLWPLRHWSADDLKNPYRFSNLHHLVDPRSTTYDASKDYWSVQSGRRPPETVKDILEFAQAFDVERQRREGNQGKSS